MSDPGLPPCRRARCLVRPRKARLVNARLAELGLQAPFHLPIHHLRDCSNFTEFEKGFLNPFSYLAEGSGVKMFGISFNRKRVKLKKLVGIRARLALLALILVTPLMLERARSLEDARGKQIALAYSEFSRIAQHSADGQRDVISSVETVLKSAAHIHASREADGRSCNILRAILPVNLPW